MHDIKLIKHTEKVLHNKISVHYTYLSDYIVCTNPDQNLLNELINCF